MSSLDVFLTEWNHKWVHLALTYDDNTLKLYVNGEYKDQLVFKFDKITVDFFQIGSFLILDQSWLGNITGYRLWADKVLTDDEVSYIKDRSFYDKSSFSEEHDTLYHNLLINMNTTASGITSLPGGYDTANNKVILTPYADIVIDNKDRHNKDCYLLL